MKRPTLHRNDGSDSLLISSPPENAATIVYCRVSDDSQAQDDKASLGTQERHCRAFAEQRGRAVDFAWIDPGVSGRDEERCERLVSWAEAHRRRGDDRGLIVVQDASRWGRFTGRPYASGFYRHRLSRAGWDLEFALQPSTGNRTTDGVVAVLHDAQAAAESEEKGRRAQMGMIGQAKLGRWTGRPPFGFDRVATSDSGKERRLAPYELAASGERVKLVAGADADVRTVRRIFDWFAEGAGVEEIARRLNKEKVPGPWVRYRERRLRKDGSRGTDKWGGFSQIDKFLHCDAYIGRRRLRPRILDDSPRGGKREFMHPDNWIVVPNAHEAIVDQGVWDKVQARLSKPHRPRATPARYLLSGLLHCRCGSLFIGGGGSREFVLSRTAATHVQVGGKRSREFRPAKPGEKATYMRVADREANTCYRCPRCREPRAITINRTWLEGRVVEQVAKHVRTVLKDGSFDKVLDELLKDQRGKRQKTRRNFEAELAEVRQERERLVQKIAKGLISDDDVKVYLGVLRDAEVMLKADQQRGRFEEQGASVGAKERQRLRAMARDFKARIAKADIATARDLLGAWVEAIRVDGRDPRKRTGQMFLRRVPLPQCGSLTSGHRAPGRPCSLAACRRFFRH